MSISNRIDDAIAAALVKRVVGCVIIVKHRGVTIYETANGFRDREAGTPMPTNAIFRLASVTKPMVATAILRLVDEGRVRLDDPVTTYLPYFTPQRPDGTRPAILIRHLLTHTAGMIGYDAVPPTISPGMAGPIITLEENLRRLAQVPLRAQPGTAWEYGMSIDVLGGVLCAVMGTTLQGALDQLVLRPLGMPDTRFGITDPARLATPYWDGSPPIRMNGAFVTENGDTFDADRIFNPDAPQSGGGGIAGTAQDVMNVIDLYQGAGSLLKPETVRMAIANQIGAVPRRADDAGKRFSFIGAVIDDARAANSPCPAGTVEWGGVWGHNWILDPVNKVSVVVCTNTTPEGCNGQFRDDIRDALYAGIAAGELKG